MEDIGIINLYFERSEEAIVEADLKYGGYCYTIAYNILSNREDSEESVNDTYMAAWKSIPPRQPRSLCAYLGKPQGIYPLITGEGSVQRKGVAQKSFLLWTSWKTVQSQIILKIHMNRKN